MIEDAVRQLASGSNIAILSTILPDGQPQSQMVWVDVDEEHILINTVVTHQKFKNVARNPRATVTIVDPARPRRYAEVRGQVVATVRGPEARAHLDRLSEKYTGRPYEREVRAERVILKISPQRQHVSGG